MKIIIIILFIFPLFTDNASGQKLKVSINCIAANDYTNKNCNCTLFAESGNKLDTITNCDSIIAYKISGDTLGIIALDWSRGYRYECHIKRDNRWVIVTLMQWYDRLSGITPPFTHIELEDVFTVKIDFHELSIQRHKIKSVKKKYNISTNTFSAINTEE